MTLHTVVTSTGVTSTGVTSTGVTSTGVTSTGVTSTGVASTVVASTAAASTAATRTGEHRDSPPRAETETSRRMGETGSRRQDAELIAAATTGNADAFATLAERHGPELRLHCYRMLGSLEDSEDVVQETLLRAWTKRATYAGRSSYRAWLYGIATHACLDLLRTRRGRVLPPDIAASADPATEPVPAADVPWLDPYPDQLIDAAAPEFEPESAAIARETTALAFLAAIQHLPPRQRAVLIMRDVLDWQARQVADALQTSAAAVNSALQRAHTTMARYLPAPGSGLAPAPPAGKTRETGPTAREKDLLVKLMSAWERADLDAVAALLSDDARLVMPPTPTWFDGRAAIATFLARHAFGPDAAGRFGTLATAANRQPAMALYARAAGQSQLVPFALIVVRIRDGAIAELVLFRKPEIFSSWGLPPAL